MNEPITWGDVLVYQELRFAFLLLLPLVAALYWTIKAVRPPGYCPTCARPLQWRWRKPWQYASRRFCPYHDAGAP